MDSKINEQVLIWRNKLLAINKNIIDLSDLASSKMLEENLTTGYYIGLTEKKTRECLNAIDNLWQNYLTLSKVIEKAEDLSKKLTILHNNSEQINFLLNEKSVVLHKEEVAVNNRQLLYDSSKDDAISPSETLEIMIKDFEKAKLNLNSIIDGEENTLKISSKMRDEIKKLKITAENLGKDARALDGYISSLEYCEKDPVVGVAQIQELSDQIYKFRDELYKSLKNSEELKKDIEESKNVLERIGRIVQINSKFILENKEVFGKTHNYSVPLNDNELEEFREWIKGLEHSLSLNRVTAVTIGINKLFYQLNSKLKDETEKLKSNREEVEYFNELKGRFTALVAKINIIGIGKNGISPKVLAVLAEVKENFQNDIVDLKKIDELLKKLYMNKLK